MATLPMILAGPIVRRLEPRLATVWLALSAEATVKLHLFEHGGLLAGATPGQSSDGPAYVSGDAVPAISFGKQLWVVAATVKLPIGGGKVLHPGSTYSYNVEVTFTDGRKTDLKTEGLLKEETSGDRPANNVDDKAPLHLALGYGENLLPTFVTLPADVGALRFAHTSCRKPHGPGYDALAWLDDVIEDTRDDLDKRPAALFLSGDQIYADDVAACLLPMLHELGKDVLGGNLAELLPTRFGNTEGTLANFPAMRRQMLCTTEARFTTTDGACHLLTFAEYAAMYLIAWSPRVWRALATADEVFKSLDDAGTNFAVRPLLTDWEGAFDGSLAKWKKAAAEQFDGHTKNIEMFRQGVPHVARALANCATYMICDDHEITDDWNLNGRWLARMDGSPLGKRIIANGLMAFGVFQAWGNDPLSFILTASGNVTDTGGNKATIELGTTLTAIPDDRAEVRVSGGATHSGKFVNSHGHRIVIAFDAAGAVAVNDEVEVTIFGPNAALLPEVKSFAANVGVDTKISPALTTLFGLGTDPVEKQARWFFAIDAGKFKFVVIDTRTRRKMADFFYSPPSLLGDSLNSQIPEPGLNAELLILVSPSPIFNPQIIQRTMAPMSAAFFDAYQYCIKRMDDKKPPLATDPTPKITGDEAFDAEGWPANEAATELLLARIAPHKRVIVLGGDVHFGYSMEMEYWRKGQATSDRIAHLTCSPAHNAVPQLLTALLRQQAGLQRYLRGEAAERLYWANNPSINLPAGMSLSIARRVRLKESPTIIGATGWPAGLTVPAGKEPDAAWRLSLVRDKRPPGDPDVPSLAQRALDAADLGPNPSQAVVLDAFAAIVNRHNSASLTQDDHMRQVVFPCNLGLVKVADRDGQPGQYTATHTLISRQSASEEGQSQSAENTVHELVLAPSGEAAPTMREG